MRGGDVATLEAGAFYQAVDPLLDFGKFGNVDAGISWVALVRPRGGRVDSGWGKGLTVGGHPAPTDNVGDGASVADEEAGGRVLELSLQAAVEPSGLVYVPIYPVLNLLRGVA